MVAALRRPIAAYLRTISKSSPRLRNRSLRNKLRTRDTANCSPVLSFSALSFFVPRMLRPQLRVDQRNAGRHTVLRYRMLGVELSHQALLGKRFWRLVRNPVAALAPVLIERYTAFGVGGPTE